MIACESSLMSSLTALLRLLQPQTIKNAWQFERELSSFRKSFPFLAAPFAGTSKGDVLIASLTDWAPQVKMEGMLAKAVAAHGYRPVILTNSSSKRAIRYFRAFGIDQFIFFNQLADAETPLITTADTENVMTQASSFHALFSYAEGANDLGRHVLSTIVRMQRSGHLTFGTPELQEMLRKMIPRSIATFRAAEKLFQGRSFAAVLFLEKGYTPYGEIFDAAVDRGLNVAQYIHSHRDEAIILKRYTRKNRFEHAFSLSPASWEAVQEMQWSDEQDDAFMKELEQAYASGTWFNRKFLLQGKKMKTPAEVRAQLKLDPKKKTAVIFSHVLWDATFFYGESLFEDYEQWLIETVKAACKNDRVNWVIKLHPDYTWKMKQLGDTGQPRDIVAMAANIGRLPDHVQVVLPDTDISTYSFFSITDYCITVRGTIGIEAPCFGIPVITAGTGRYSGLGFTEDSETRSAYLELLNHIEEIPKLSPKKAALARKHAFALFECRPLSFTTFQTVRTPGEPGKALGYDVAIRAKSQKDVTDASDIKTFIDWLLHSKDEDYLRIP